MISLSIYLYGKPNWELPIEGINHLDPIIIREHGKELQARLNHIADVVEKLQLEGWQLSECYGAIYNLDFYKEEITLKQARQELKDLGIDLRSIYLEELDEFEEELEQF